MAGKSLIQQAAGKNMPQTAPANAMMAAGKQSVSAILNGILDGEGYRKRIDEVLGKRAPQFISSIVSMASNDTMLRKVVASAPQTIIASALKAAALDLPIDPQLGMAYVVSFKNSVKGPDGKPIKDANGYNVTRDEAQLLVGYRGMIQLAQRTGLYKYLNAGIVYEGEKIIDDRISGMIKIEGEKTSDTAIGYFAYFQLLNGFEKCVCWTRDKVKAHEEKNRKGKFMSKTWAEDFDSMAIKTVLRNLLSKWGPMSIDYHTAPPEIAKAADGLQNALAMDDENGPIESEGVVFEDAPSPTDTIDQETGEITKEQ